MQDIFTPAVTHLRRLFGAVELKPDDTPNQRDISTR